MSVLLDLRHKLQETQAALVEVERAIAKNPDDKGLSLTATSLQKRQTDLDKAFRRSANLEHVDVCTYRLISDDREEYSIASLTATLNAFQDLVTVVFDAIKTGPKIRPRISPDIVQQSSFDFGYAYPGSLGLVLTIPNERLLLGESDLDRAINIIFDMVKAQTPNELSRYVSDVGVAGIRRLYRWSKSHSDHRINADIRWQRSQEDRASVVIQTQELLRLEEIIEETGDEIEDIVSVDGELIGLDVGTRNFFHLKVVRADDIIGKISEEFKKKKTYEIHGFYSAKLLKRQKIHYSIEKEEESWELISLDEVVNAQQD